MALDETTLRQIVRDELRPVREDVLLTKELLTGNGDPDKGMVIRVDRLERSVAQRNESTTYWTRASLGAAISAIVASTWAIITGK